MEKSFPEELMFPWVSGSWDDRIDFLRMRVNFDRRDGWMMMMMGI